MSAATRLAAVPPPAPGHELGTFENKEVVGIETIITHTGANLDKALKLAPVVHENGDECYILLKCIVVDVRHPNWVPTKDEAEDDDGTLKVLRLQVYKAEGAIPIAAGPATDRLEETMRAIKEAEKAARDAKRGQKTLDLDKANEAEDAEGLRDEQDGDAEGDDEL